MITWRIKDRTQRERETSQPDQLCMIIEILYYESILSSTASFLYFTKSLMELNKIMSYLAPKTLKNFNKLKTNLCIGSLLFLIQGKRELSKDYILRSKSNKGQNEGKANHYNITPFPPLLQIQNLDSPMNEGSTNVHDRIDQDQIITTLNSLA